MSATRILTSREAMLQREESRRERILMEAYRGNYPTHHHLVSALHAEASQAPRGRSIRGILETLPDVGETTHAPPPGDTP